jgi:hypothetical protein
MHRYRIRRRIVNAIGWVIAWLLVRAVKRQGL